MVVPDGLSASAWAAVSTACSISAPTLRSVPSVALATMEIAPPVIIMAFRSHGGIQSSRINEIDRIAIRKSVGVDASDQPNRIFLSETAGVRVVVSIPSVARAGGIGLVL